MDEAAIYADLLGRLTTDDDYLGIIGGDGNTLQMMYQAEVMETLPRKFAPEAIPDLVFKAW